MAKQLELQFFNEDERTVTISLENPIEPVDPETVKTVMDTIISENVFMTSGGDLVSKKGARIVERTVTDIDIE